MNFFEGAIAFLFGAIVGSFLNVVILRYNTGASFFSGRSFCASCGKKLLWYELIPILSFFILRGKCSECGSKISWQYPFVELATGILFLLTICKLPGTALDPPYYVLFTTYYLLTWCLLVVIAVYDLRHKIIPDALSYSFAALALAHLVFTLGPERVFMASHLSHLLAGPLLAAPFAALWLFSRGRWMGLGDAKLALGIGWFLGLSAGGSAIIFATWIGALTGILLIVAQKIPLNSVMIPRIGMRMEVPFAPFLVAGTMLAFFTGWNIFDLGFVLF